MRMTYVLVIVLALAGAAVLGFVAARDDGGAPAPVAAEPMPGPEHAADAQRTRLRGKVLETIDVPGYTYLRIGDGQAGGTWAAVAAPADVAEGQPVTVVVETRMSDFASKALDRTFDTIYFGAIEGSAGPSAPSAGGASPHGSGTTADRVDVASVERAGGEHGVRIAELYARRTELVGSTVRVRGVVVKRTPGVMGRTFVHLQDGSGAADRGDHDLTVTMTDTPEVGDTLLVEGEVTIDKDFGAGYRYDLILEDVRLPGS
jgi:hypothetical protein